MQKSGGVVIRMQTNSSDEILRISNQLTFLSGDAERLQKLSEMPVLPVFDEKQIDFFDVFSKKLLHDKEARQYSDLIALGYWCRKTSIYEMRDKINCNLSRRGRGIAFHIAPSNVAVNFMYSIIVSMLAGNVNVVRLSERDFVQVDVIVRLLKEMETDYEQIAERLVLVRYPRSKEINDLFSQMCDVRIVWGGDQTIQTLRQSALKPRAKEICFADRYSICMIDADAYLECDDKKKLATGFYNDTYLTDQNACTSPKLVVWLGEHKKEARKVFWQELQQLIDKKYHIEPVQIIDKLDTVLKYAAVAKDDVNPKYIQSANALSLMRVELSAVEQYLPSIHQHSGLFFEYEADKMADILAVCTDKLQTIAVYGISKIQFEKFINEHLQRGIDRIVPIGSTMDFSFIWDGYDLVSELSRVISIEV